MKRTPELLKDEKTNKAAPKFCFSGFRKKISFFYFVKLRLTWKNFLVNFYAFQASSAPPHLVKTGPRFSLINLISFQ